MTAPLWMTEGGITHEVVDSPPATGTPRTLAERIETHKHHEVSVNRYLLAVSRMDGIVCRGIGVSSPALTIGSPSPVFLRQLGTDTGSATAHALAGLIRLPCRRRRLQMVAASTRADRVSLLAASTAQSVETRQHTPIRFLVSASSPKWRRRTLPVRWMQPGESSRRMRVCPEQEKRDAGSSSLERWASPVM